MAHPAQLTLSEIHAQPQAWAEAIQVVEQQRPVIAEFNLSNYDLLVFIGCGSTYYLSLSAAGVMQTLTGINSRAVPSSEILLSPKPFSRQVSVSHCVPSPVLVQQQRLYAPSKNSLLIT